MAKQKARRKTPGRPSAAVAVVPTAAAPFFPTAAILATSCLLIAAVELALSVYVSNTALLNDQLPLGARVALAGHGLAALMTGVCLTFVLLVLVTWLGQRAGANAAVRWTVGGTRTLVVCLAVFLYISSWALFWNTDVFLDRQAFAFLAAMDPVQVFHWVYPPLAIGVIVATLIATVALVRLVPNWVARRRPDTQRRTVLAGVATLAGCVVAALTGHVIYGSDAIVPDQPKSEYAVMRDDRAGPVAHALADLNRRPSEDVPAVAAVDGDRVIRRPIISMEQYVAGIPPGALKRRNVVMIQIESLRSDQLRAYGGTRDVMPAVDALARESRVFTNAYIQASHSNYQDLVPLSSHYPLRSPGMYEYPPNPTYPRVLIYDVLKALDYKTAIFSSQNERWGGMLNYHRPESLDRFFHAETFTGETSAPWGDLGFAEWVRETKSAGSVDDRYTVDEAIKWMATLSGQPFFVHMNLQSSHVPYVIPDDFPHRFSPKKLDFAIMWGKFPIEKIDIVKGRYADSLFYEDTQLARLFEYLKSNGLWENTVIVVGGDNGEAFYEHGFAAHASSLFNEVMKVPMIIRAPDLEPGVDDRPAMFIDVPPSVFELLGLPSHPSFQGIGLIHSQPDPNRSLYMIVQTPAATQSAIVRSGFKLLFNELDGRYFLYDLVNDPEESPRKNLASSRPDLVDELNRRLRFWRAEQLSYYADVPRHSREYPPVVKD
jgi:arylsulfatase A-like enzyme